jgi:7-carboxy-7-deazaguanine synthase
LLDMKLPVPHSDAAREVGDTQDRLRIAETFTSIQGEGRLSGTPSHFIRISGCNLRCTWCDTPYASWDPEGGARSLADLAADAATSGARHVVITGGEPMVFPAVTALTRELHEVGLHITIETAGTVAREVACDLMSISPKLANSTPRRGDARDPAGDWRARHESRRLNIGALQDLIDAYLERQLKFVVSHPSDLAEIDLILSQLRGWMPGDIMLMPEGVAPPSTETSARLGRECAERGWRFCRRLHIDLFGNKRGT